MHAPMNRLERTLMAAFLAHRFDDGLVFVRGREDRRRLKQAIRFGLVTQEGYLTAAGLRFCERHLHVAPGEAAPKLHSPA